MDTLAFLSKILPSRGNYFVATLQQGKERPWFRHYHCESRERAAQMALHLDSSGENVYYACSSFREESITDKDGKKRQRVQDNVLLVRSFWLDLDVGESDPGRPAKYATQADAIKGLGAFLKDTGLPCPMVVSSGNGLHCYWPLTEDIIPPQWLTAARMLKDLCANTGLLADPSRTSDHASVLRPVGTFNKKNNAAKPVEVVRDSQPLSFRQFFHLLESAAREKGLAKPVPRTEPQGINEKFLVATDFPDSRADLIANRCAQIRSMRDTGGSIPEPVWYAALQVLYHTVEKEQVIHAWSSGYLGYDHDETDRKIAQIREMGPTTCKTFGERSPEGCVGCPYKGKITSPIQLGVQRESLAAPVVVQHNGVEAVKVEIPNPPHPFVRSKDGIFVEIEAGAQQKICDYDIYPIENTEDEHLGMRTVTVCAHLPHDGQKVFSIPLRTLGSPKDFAQAMLDQGITKSNLKIMQNYLESYIHTLQGKYATRKLVQHFGWTNDKLDTFALGRKLFVHDGSVIEAKVSSKFSDDTVEGFRTKGSVQPWSDATQVLNTPGTEAHAFSLLLGFGTPLLKLTGLHGVVFSLYGDTNAGKSSMGHWLLSIYGNYEKIKMGQKDTDLARIERIGSLCNLPVYVDESTKFENDYVSDLAYLITRGETRRRLRQDGSERPAPTFSTFLITSTNQSLQAKLEATSSNSKAEQVRVFEYELSTVPALADWEKLYDVINENQGVAADVYLRYVVQNVPAIKADIRKMSEAIRSAAKCEADERYWVAGVACTIVGGLIARKLGLIQFDIAPVMKWVIAQFGQLRAIVAGSRHDSVSVLCQYLDMLSANNRIVIGKYDDKVQGQVDPIRPPRGQLLQRYETHSGVLYTNLDHLKQYLTDHRLDINSMRKDLLQKGVLMKAFARKTLGAGTDHASGQVTCWQINMKHPALKDVVEKEAVE